MRDLSAASRPRAVVKGAGDLATGVALCLHRAGFAVAMTEISRPSVVRRTVAFAQAVYDGSATVEGTRAVRVDPAGVEGALAQDLIAVVVAEDPAPVLAVVRPALLVDAIIAKRNLGTSIGDAPAVVALGPGFMAGHDAHVVIETRRGHDLGRILFEGSAQANTGVPGDIGGYTWQRVVRSPCAGAFRTVAEIGDLVTAGDVLGYVGSSRCTRRSTACSAACCTRARSDGGLQARRRGPARRRVAVLHRLGQGPGRRRRSAHRRLHAPRRSALRDIGGHRPARGRRVAEGGVMDAEAVPCGAT